MANLTQTIPAYALSAICLLSTISRFTSSSTSSPNDPTLSLILSFLTNFQTFPSAVSIDNADSTESNTYINAVLVPALMDLTLAVLILSKRTRFWACGTVLVLLSMSVGTNMKRTEVGRAEDVGTDAASPAPVGRFEINMFKLMVANLATLGAWRDGGVGKWLLSGSPREGQRAPGASADGGQMAAAGAVEASGRDGRNNGGPISVHERLR